MYLLSVKACSDDVYVILVIQSKVFSSKKGFFFFTSTDIVKTTNNWKLWKSHLLTRQGENKFSQAVSELAGYSSILACINNPKCHIKGHRLELGLILIDFLVKVVVTSRLRLAEILWAGISLRSVHRPLNFTFSDLHFFLYPIYLRCAVSLIPPNALQGTFTWLNKWQKLQLSRARVLWW